MGFKKMLEMDVVVPDPHPYNLALEARPRYHFDVIVSCCMHVRFPRSYRSFRLANFLMCCYGTSWHIRSPRLVAVGK